MIICFSIQIDIYCAVMSESESRTPYCSTECMRLYYLSIFVSHALEVKEMFNCLGHTAAAKRAIRKSLQYLAAQRKWSM